jgi:Phage integrase family
MAFSRAGAGCSRLTGAGCRAFGLVVVQVAVRSVLGLDGFWELIGPGAKHVRGFAAEILVCLVFMERALACWPCELAVELKVLEAVRCHVVAASGEDDAGDASPIASGQAHGAWFAAAVQGSVVDKVPLQLGGCAAQRHDFCVRGWVEQLDDAARSFSDDLVPAALEAAVLEGKLVRNVARLVKPPEHTPRERDTWSKAEVRKFLAKASTDRLYVAWRLSLYGLRRGEVLGLRWSDVDLRARTLTVNQARVLVEYRVGIEEPKSRNGKRTLPLDAELVAALTRCTNVSWRRARARARRTGPESPSWTGTKAAST